MHLGCKKDAHLNAAPNVCRLADSWNRFAWPSHGGFRFAEFFVGSPEVAFYPVAALTQRQLAPDSPDFGIHCSKVRLPAIWGRSVNYFDVLRPAAPKNDAGKLTHQASDNRFLTLDRLRGRCTALSGRWHAPCIIGIGSYLFDATTWLLW
jgi:hypothetical protein